ncbi:hypothetical protein SESBI_02296 [Sesbania bispinosa]|nr:hypothetical protein SESBI_02296 [Sesbania bispinosa]
MEKHKHNLLVEFDTNDVLGDVLDTFGAAMVELVRHILVAASLLLPNDNGEVPSQETMAVAKLSLCRPTVITRRSPKPLHCALSRPPCHLLAQPIIRRTLALSFQTPPIFRELPCRTPSSH